MSASNSPPPTYKIHCLLFDAEHNPESQIWSWTVESEDFKLSFEDQILAIMDFLYEKYQFRARSTSINVYQVLGAFYLASFVTFVDYVVPI